MATRKFTAFMGKRDRVVTEGAGTSIAGGEAVEVNFDFTKMTRGQAVKLLDRVKERITEGKWPPA